MTGTSQCGEVGYLLDFIPVAPDLAPAGCKQHQKN